MVNRLSKFQLIDQEDEGVVLGQNDIKDRQEEGVRSLLGKVWGSKMANYTGLKQTFTQLWCPSGQL